MLLEGDAKHSIGEVDLDLVLVHGQRQSDAALNCGRRVSGSDEE